MAAWTQPVLHQRARWSIGCDPPEQFEAIRMKRSAICRAANEKEVSDSSGETHITNFDAILSIGCGCELQLRITLCARHVVTIGNFMSVRPCDTKNWIHIRSQSPSKDFGADSLTATSATRKNRERTALSCPFRQQGEEINCATLRSSLSAAAAIDGKSSTTTKAASEQP